VSHSDDFRGDHSYDDNHGNGGDPDDGDRSVGNDL
jgi:hypothetical protein